jgi:hypothetical protein
MRRMSSVAVALVVAAIAVPAALGAPPAPSAPPPTLTGEQLVATLSPTAVQATCDPAGTSTLTLSTGGAATGPYPGTWTGVITVRIGPQVGPAALLGLHTGPLAEWREAFRIDSAVGTVTGTKTLLVDPGNVGQCRQFHGDQPPELFGVNLNGYVYTATAHALAYQATISVPRGRTFRDAGRASATLSGSHVTCCPNEAGLDLETRSDTHSFAEQFQSTLPATQETRGSRDLRDEKEGRGCRDDGSGYGYGYGFGHQERGGDCGDGRGDR